MGDKKRIERIYLNEARAASSLFPAGEPEPHEPLDFLFGSVGIEITELCHEDARKEGARLGYVVFAPAAYMRARISVGKGSL